MSQNNICRQRPFEHQLNELVNKLYDAVTDTSKWTIFLADLASFFDADVAHLGNIDPANNCLTFTLLHGFDDHLQRYRKAGENSWEPAIERWSKEFSRFMPSDPRIAIMQAKPNRPFSCRLEIDERDYHQSDMYVELLDATDIEYSLLVTVPGEEGLLTGLGVFRGKAGKPFSQDDVDRFGLLVPHLRRVAQLQSIFVSCRTERLMALEALDNLPMGILIVDRFCRMHHANSSALELIERDDIFALGNDSEFMTRSDLSSQITKNIQQCALASIEQNTSDSAVYLVPKSDKTTSYSLLISPLWRNAMRFIPDCSPEPMAVLYISDPDSPQERPVELLQRLYGLTKAETRVVNALVSGENLKQMAVSFCVSVHTVRGQLKSIFSKTNTSSQSELIRLIMSSPLNVPSGFKPDEER